MKIVFLDIDGVLNSMQYEREIAIRYGVDDPWWDDYLGTAKELDPDAVARLNRLVRETDAVIVVSSSWREDFNLLQLRKILRDAGFKGIVFDVTPQKLRDPDSVTGKLLMRGGEIQAWLDAHRSLDIESFVVLDDAGGQRIEPMISRLVQTSAVVGMTDEQVDRAIALLNSGAHSESHRQ